LDLIIRARDVNQISSLYVTKKIYELDYLANFRAELLASGEIRTSETRRAQLPRTRVIVLEDGEIVFDGRVTEFSESKLPAIRELLSLDRHTHAHDPYFMDPWDKRRHPAELIL
jgi:hypothetical protein